MKQVTILFLLFSVLTACTPYRGYTYYFNDSYTDLVSEFDSLYTKDSSLIVNYKKREIINDSLVFSTENANCMGSHDEYDRVYYWFRLHKKEEDFIVSAIIRDVDNNVSAILRDVDNNETFRAWVCLKCWAKDFDVYPVDSHLFGSHDASYNEQCLIIQEFEDQVLKRIGTNYCEKDDRQSIWGWILFNKIVQ